MVSFRQLICGVFFLALVFLLCNVSLGEQIFIRIDSLNFKKPIQEVVDVGREWKPRFVLSPTEFFQMRLENNTNIKQTVMLCLFPKTITGIGAGVPRQDARRCWIAEADKKQPKFLLFKLFASVFRSGEYGMDMAFFTPDVRKQHSRRWHLGTLKISNKDADKIKWPEYPYLEIPEEFQQRFNQTILLAWRDADYEQDEIVPEIGEPPRNPPNASWLWMPLFLSFVILVPWSLLIWGWTKIRPINITQFWELFSEESSASNRAIAVGTNSFLVRIVAAVLFQASLFSMVFLLVLHWLYLDLFSFIKVFASLTLLASISAWFHLRDLAIIRSSSRSDPAVAASSISRKDK